MPRFLVKSFTDEGVERVYRRGGVFETRNSGNDEGVERVCRKGGVADGTNPRNSGVGDERV